MANTVTNKEDSYRQDSPTYDLPVQNTLYLTFCFLPPILSVSHIHIHTTFTVLDYSTGCGKRESHINWSKGLLD